MDNMIKDLHEMCETIARAIATANEKIRSAGGKVSNADMEYVDRLTHSLKSLKTTIAMIEAENMDEGEYSERGYSMNGSSYRRGYSRDDGIRNGYSRMEGSYARGRGPYAKRDSMGRYSNGYGYAQEGGMVDDLREMMQSAPDEQTRQEFQRLIQKMEQR